MVVLNNGDQISYDMLPHQLLSLAATTAEQSMAAEPERGRAADPAPATSAVADGMSGDTIRPLWLEARDIIERAIALCAGYIPKAAALLEISASTIYRKRAVWEKQAAGEASNTA